METQQGNQQPAPPQIQFDRSVGLEDAHSMGIETSKLLFARPGFSEPITIGSYVPAAAIRVGTAADGTPVASCMLPHELLVLRIVNQNFSDFEDFCAGAAQCPGCVSGEHADGAFKQTIGQTIVVISCMQRHGDISKITPALLKDLVERLPEMTDDERAEHGFVHTNIVRVTTVGNDGTTMQTVVSRDKDGGITTANMKELETGNFEMPSAGPFEKAVVRVLH